MWFRFSLLFFLPWSLDEVIFAFHPIQPISTSLEVNYYFPYLRHYQIRWRKQPFWNQTLVHWQSHSRVHCFGTCKWVEKEYNIGKPFTGNKSMQKWDTNGDFIEGKCIVQIISFHERHPYKNKNPECSWAETSSCSWSLIILEFKDNSKFNENPIIQNLSS